MAGREVAERVGRVLEQLGVRQAVDRTRRQAALHRGIGHVDGRPRGWPDALPGRVASRSARHGTYLTSHGNEEHRHDEHAEQSRDEEQERLELTADEDERLTGGRERLRRQIIDPGADQRQAAERVA